MRMVRDSQNLYPAALVACLLALTGCLGRPPAPDVSLAEVGLVLGSVNQNEPFVIELGRVPPDSTHIRKVSLKNETSNPIRIDGFKASCECTSVGGLPVDVPAGKVRDVSVLTDLASEPGFTGGLAIRVEISSGADVRGLIEIRCEASGTGVEAP